MLFIGCLFLAFSLVGFMGCSEDENPVAPGGGGGGGCSGPFTFILDGAPHNYSVTNMGAYSTSMSNTSVGGMFVSGPTTNTIMVSFPGNAAGAWTAASGANVMLIGTIGFYVSTVCTVNVATYGAVGAQIQGTFTATVTNIFAGGTKTITAGVFDILRLADQP